VEELIPTLHQLFHVNRNQVLQSADFFSAETMAALQADRIEPKLCLTVVAFDMNGGRLATVARAKKEPVRPGTQYRGHIVTLRQSGFPINWPQKG
jgi:hypothetical protein